MPVPYDCVVCVKQVPDTANVTGDAMRPDGTVNRTALPTIFNPDDLHALEMALQVRDAYGGTVTVISMGPPKAGDVLRDALYRGADRAVLITDRRAAASDTLATSYIISKAIKNVGNFDLVFCGRQAIDGDTAQVGPGVAEFLNLPIITYVRKVEVEGTLAKVERVFEDGYERMEAELPLVLTVLKEMNVPRMASLRGRMKAKKAEIKRWTAAEIGADPDHTGLAGSPTKVVKIFSPPKKTGGIKLEGTAPLDAARSVIGKLKEQKVI